MLEEWGRSKGCGRGELNILLSRQEEKYERGCYGGSVAEGLARGRMGRVLVSIYYKTFSFGGVCVFFLIFEKCMHVLL